MPAKPAPKLAIRAPQRPAGPRAPAPAGAPAAPARGPAASPFRPFVNPRPGVPAPGAPPPRGASPARPTPPPSSAATAKPSPADESPRSSLAQAVEDRGRRFRIFPLTGFWGVGGKPIERVGILYGVDRDGDAAMLAAHAYIADAEKRHGAHGAGSDKDLLGAVKLRELLYRLCRRVDAKHHDRLATTADGQHAYPAFPSPNWMRDHLGPEEIGTLLRLVEEVRSEFGPKRLDGGEPWGLEDEAVDGLAAELVDAARAGETPGAHLAHLPRAAVTRLCVRLAERLQAAQAARDALLAGAQVLAPTAAPAPSSDPS